MQKALPSTKQKLTKLVGEMSDDVAREVLHYAQYLASQNEGDTAFDSALMSMPDELAQMFIAEAAEAKQAGTIKPLFNKNGKLARS